MTRTPPSPRSRMAGLAALGLVAAVQGCDPCSGYAQCEVAPHVTYSGQFVERTTGRKIGGAEVLFVRVDGVELERDTLRARTDADGFFLLSGHALQEGQVRGTFIVNPPDRGGYRVDFVTLRTSTRAGDGGQLGRLVVDPYTVYVALVTDRATGQPVPGATVRWRRTGGIMATPADTVLTTTGDALIVIVFRGETHGVIEGEFTVTSASLGAFAPAPVQIWTDWSDRTPYLSYLPLDRVPAGATPSPAP